MQRSDFLPPVDCGAASLVLSMIATLLVFLPVLSIPIAVCAALSAIAGISSATLRHQEPLRWSLGGLSLSLLVLIAGLAINFAPQNEQPSPLVPPLWQEPSPAPFVAPPARSN